jgi:hypothetical protein
MPVLVVEHLAVCAVADLAVRSMTSETRNARRGGRAFAWIDAWPTRKSALSQY